MPEIIRKTAVAALLLIGGLFIVFAVGYALEDLGGWAGAAMSAAWVVPTVLLGWLAWKRPVAGAWAAVPLVAVAMICAALGAHRSGLVGWLLLGLAVANLAGIYLEEIARGGGGPGPLGLLSSSDGVLLVPILVAGGLLIVADLLERHQPATSGGHPARA